MRAIRLSPAEVSEAIVGTILCHDITAAGERGRVKLGKGRLLRAEDILPLKNCSRDIHVAYVDQGDVHEDSAAVRLASAIAGNGIEVSGPVESQVHLRAAFRGIVTIKQESLVALNSLPDVSVFTVYDGQPVSQGKAIAAAKVTPLLVQESIILEAEAIAQRDTPIVSLEPFLHKPVGVVVRDTLAGSTREKFENALQIKLNWFGSRVSGIRYVSDDVNAIARELNDFGDDDVALILAAGVNSTDPLDPTLQALDRVGAITERRGVPAHPGSTCWLSYMGHIPVFGLALCGMFSMTTVLDLLLPRFLSGQEVRAVHLAHFGYGGVLGRDMAFRFPNYLEDGPPA